MAKSYKPEELTARYGKSAEGNFYVKDTIGVPHPYCITARHVAWAADHHGGMLGTAAIEDAEKHGIYCATCRGQLKIAQHETALLVACEVDMKVGNAAHPELEAYLKSIVKKCEEDGFAGFAFLDAR